MLGRIAADSDNKELMQFLGKKFDGIDERFESIEKQFEGIHKRLDNTPTKDDLEDVKRHTGVLVEAVRSDIKIVIEGLTGSNERRERDKEEHEQEHTRLEKMSLINTADISKLDHRVGRLEGGT